MAEGFAICLMAKSVNTSFEIKICCKLIHFRVPGQSRYYSIRKANVVDVYKGSKKSLVPFYHCTSDISNHLY